MCATLSFGQKTFNYWALIGRVAGVLNGILPADKLRQHGDAGLRQDRPVRRVGLKIRRRLRRIRIRHHLGDEVWGRRIAGEEVNQNFDVRLASGP